MFRWDDMGMVLALQRGGSLSAAARALRVDPSTVSRRLRAFEEAVGGALFIRTPEGMRPTERAARLLPHAEQMEAAAQAAQAAMEGAELGVEGTVRIAASEGFGAYVLAPALPELFARHPSLNIDLIVGPSLVDMTRREADIAVRFVRPEAGDLVARRVARTGRYAAHARTDVAARLADKPPEDIDWIGWIPELGHLPEAQLQETLAATPPRLRSDSYVVMVEALRAGAGAMLFPVGLASADEEIVTIDTAPQLSIDVDVWLVTIRALRHVPRVAAVWDWLEELTARMVPVNDTSAPRTD